MLKKMIASLAMLGCLSAVHAKDPAWALRSTNPSYAASVSKITKTSTTDILLLKGGADQGLRIGMLCKVSNRNALLANVVLIAVEKNHSAALILKRFKSVGIQSGDAVKVQTQR